MHALGGVLLGLINVAIVVAIFLLVGYVIVLIFETLLKITIPWPIKQLYLVIVTLVALYMIVSLLLGVATPFRVLSQYGPLLLYSGYCHDTALC